MISADIKVKQEKLVRAMEDAGIDACLICTPVNLYYISGCIFDGYFYLSANGDAHAFVRRGSVADGLCCHSIRKPGQIPAILKELSLAQPRTLMLEDDYLSAANYLRLKKVFEGATLARNLLRAVRSIKTDAELDMLKASAAAHGRAYACIHKLYRPGMTDIQFSIEIERLMRQNGNLGMFRMLGTNMEIFMGSVLAGDNALTVSPYDFAMGGAGMHPSLPIGANGTPLCEGNTVMVDINGNFTGYISDMTRTFCVGRLPQRAYDLHNLSIEVQQELSLSKAGDSCAELYEKAVQIIKKYGAWDEYMENIQKSRFVGHGLGLEVNEPPVLSKNSKAILKENMCLALEPKFILKGVGPLGTENTYIVRKNGLEKITHTPEEIIQLA